MPKQICTCDILCLLLRRKAAKATNTHTARPTTGVISQLMSRHIPWPLRKAAGVTDPDSCLNCLILFTKASASSLSTLLTSGSFSPLPPPIPSSPSSSFLLLILLFFFFLSSPPPLLLNVLCWCCCCYITLLASWSIICWCVR